MLATICDASGNQLRTEERGDPVCGEDFCDICGDCLACYQCDCYGSGQPETGGLHWWVIYEEGEDDPD